MQHFKRSQLKPRIIYNYQVAKVTNCHLNFTKVIKTIVTRKVVMHREKETEANEKEY